MLRTLFLLLAVLLPLVGCSRPAPAPTPEVPPVVVVTEPADDGSLPPPRVVEKRQPRAALTAGVAYLLGEQSADGAWRSDVYATFKDGTALTPLAVCAIQDAHDAGDRTPEVEAAIKKGVAWLAKFVKTDGNIEPPADGFDYPLYTASLSVKALSHPTAKDFVLSREAWVKYIKARQLTEKLGWKPEDKQYGGWGYCRVIPKKPEPNTFAPPLIESNLSATTFALDALKTAGELDPDTAKIAAVFVRRCRNTDGGFHFIYDDPTRNKAGIAQATPLTFHSYGSTTADGLRALGYCKSEEEDKSRIAAAHIWLEEYFRADTHPGEYIKAHESNREAVYYYYAASVSRAFRENKLKLPNGRDWAAELSHELAQRQMKDGHWENRVELVRENDPIVATCNAVSALANCTLARR